MENIQQQVDQIFAEWDHTTTPGCALAVIKDGQIVYSRGYGIANLEYGIPIRPDTVFHIASVSKHFAALAITLLAHEGKLSLDDEVRKYIPELSDFGGTEPKITIRHLIHHTSGLRDQWELLIAAGWRMDDVITMEDILDIVSQQKELNFKPGEKHLYCNTGYTLISFIVQRVSGKSMREFCQERLFGPLGMKNTHFHDDHTLVVPNRAVSYYPTGYNEFHIAVLSYANVGATSLFTTVEDMAKWDQEFYEGKVFGKDVIEEMHTQGVLNSGEVLTYAYGLMIGEYRGLKTVEHSGGDAGYRTHLLRFPDQHFSVVVFSNHATAGPSQLTYKVADLYLQDALQPQVTGEDKPAELPAEALQKFAGQYYSAKDHSQHLLEFKDGKLSVSGLELEPLSEDTLRIKVYPTIKMILNETPVGPKLDVIWFGSKKPETFDKVEPPSFTPEQIEAYTGTYNSPELGVSCEVVSQDGQLSLKRRKYGITPLKPISGDAFNCGFFNMVFYRNGGSEIEGVRLYSGRVLGLRYVKQPAAK